MILCVLERWSRDLSMKILKKMCTSFCHHVYFQEGDTVLPMMISVMILLRVLTMKRSNWTSLDTRVNFPGYALVLPASFVISVK